MLPWLIYWTHVVRERTSELEQWASKQPNPTTARYRYKRDPPLVDGFVIEVDHYTTHTSQHIISIWIHGVYHVP
jgi:hypothetical protein